MTAAEARAIHAAPVDPQQLRKAIAKIETAIRRAAECGHDHARITADCLCDVGADHPKMVEAIAASLAADGYTVQCQACVVQTRHSMIFGVHSGYGPIIDVSWSIGPKDRK